MNMNALIALQAAEEKAAALFLEIEKRGIIAAGKTEKDVNQAIYNLAEELFGIKKYWHKRIVRSGKNTLLPYRHNPPNLTLQDEDIVFLDFGPVFDEWEADFGRTYVLGNHPKMRQLARDVEQAWQEGAAFFHQNYVALTGADFYNFTSELAKKYGWEYGNEHCGHLVGNFPHEKILGEERVNYLHPENTALVSARALNGDERFWIYEIHFVDRELGIGGFYEQLVSTRDDRA